MLVRPTVALLAWFVLLGEPGIVTAQTQAEQDVPTEPRPQNVPEEPEKPPSDETSSDETSSNETSSDETSSNETSSDETSSDETTALYRPQLRATVELHNDVPISQPRIKKKSKINMGGLVFLVADLQDEMDEESTLEVALKGARTFLEYRKDWLEAEVGVELADKVKLRDAFAQATVANVSFKVGRFKQPTSLLSGESRWSLPIVDRGAIDKSLKDILFVGGRRVGAQFEWRSRGDLKLRTKAGVFQTTDSDGDALEEAGLHSPSLSARMEIGSEYVTVGAFASNQAVEADDAITHTFAAGADARVEIPAGRQAKAKLWAEFIGGETTFLDPMGASTSFLAIRGVFSVELMLGRSSNFHLDPFLRLDLLNPDAFHGSDWLGDAAAGLNFGFRNKLRIALEIEQQRSGATSPGTLKIADQSRNIRVLAGSAF